MSKISSNTSDSGDKPKVEDTTAAPPPITNSVVSYGGDNITTSPHDDDDNPPNTRTLLLIMVAIALIFFLGSLDQTIVGTAIPKITDEFGGLDKVSWYGSAYFMTLGGFQSAWGKINKYFSLKGSFLACLFIFELGSLICAVAPNAEVFIAGRAIAGIGCAGITTGGMTIVGFIAPPEKRPMYTSILGATYGIAAIFGPLIGGLFSNSVTWRWCFYINLPIGGFSAIIFILFFRAPAIAKSTENTTLRIKLINMDPVSIILAMGIMVSFIIALQYGGQEYSWKDKTVIGLLVGFILMTILFVIWQIYFGEKATIPPRIFGRHVIWGTSCFQFFFAGSYFISLYYLPIYFQSVQGVDPITSGVRNIPLIITASVFLVAAGIGVTLLGRPAPFMLVGSALAVVACGLFYTLDTTTKTVTWAGYQVLAGIAWGSAFQMTMIIVQANVDASDLSIATAINYFFQIFGGAFGLSAAQSGFVNKLISTLRETAPNIDPAKVIATGSTQIRSVFTADEIPLVIDAYMAGLRVVFAIMAGFAGFAFLASFTQKWQRINTSPTRVE